MNYKSLKYIYIYILNVESNIMGQYHSRCKPESWGPNWSMDISSLKVCNIVWLLAAELSDTKAQILLITFAKLFAIKSLSRMANNVPSMPSATTTTTINQLNNNYHNHGHTENSISLQSRLHAYKISYWFLGIKTVTECIPVSSY